MLKYRAMFCVEVIKGVKVVKLQLSVTKLSVSFYLTIMTVHHCVLEA